MRTEEEIRAQQTTVLASWRGQGERGGLTIESSWLLKGWEDALKWVLNEENEQ